MTTNGKSQQRDGNFTKRCCQMEKLGKTRNQNNRKPWSQRWRTRHIKQAQRQPGQSCGLDVREPGNRAREIVWPETHNEKSKKNKNGTQELWTTSKVQVHRVQVQRQRERGAEEISEEIRGKNSPKINKRQQTRYPGRSENTQPGEHEALSAPSGVKVCASVSAVPSNRCSTNERLGTQERKCSVLRVTDENVNSRGAGNPRKRGWQAQRTGVSRQLLSRLVNRIHALHFLLQGHILYFIVKTLRLALETLLICHTPWDKGD